MAVYRERAMRPPKIGRAGISSLPPPSSRFDLTKTPGYEPAQAVAEEDRHRAAMLRYRASKAKARLARALSELADTIDPDVTANPTTPASSRYMRDQRNRVIGAIWELIDDLKRSIEPESRHAYAVFTAIPEDSSVPLGRLNCFNPVRFMAAFRQDIYRSAKKLGVAVEGQLFAALHGAYDTDTKSYPLHIHGIAIGPMVEIVDDLRRLRKYHSAQPHDGRDAASTPVRISRGPLTNMPEPLTYTMKRFWPVRETYMDSDGLRKSWGGRVRRIRGEAGVEYLQFLDRWRLEDVTLLMGMHVTNEGLVLTK